MDSVCRVVLPGIALFQHPSFIDKRSQEMDVIRHDHEIVDVVSLAVKMKEAVRNDIRQRRLAQNTGAVAIVQMPVPAPGKRPRELASDRGIEFKEQLAPVFLPRIHPVSAQPTLALGMPPAQDAFGNRIKRPERDEANRAGLSPMRQLPLDDAEVGSGVESLQRPER